MDQKDGVIVLLDSLGTKNRSIRESRDFIKKRDHIVKFVKDYSKDLHLEKRYGDLVQYTFGDTLLLAFERLNVIGTPLVLLGRLLRYLLVESMENEGILWRGALSIGKYIEDERSNTIIGPAVGDAAAWYEAANWFGVICTPHSALVVKRLFEEMSGSADVVKKLRETFVDYDVPIEGGKALRVPAIAWPVEMLEKGMTKLPDGNTTSPLANLYRILSGFSIPMKTEDKYINAIAFFKHCQEQMGE